VQYFTKNYLINIHYNIRQLINNNTIIYQDFYDTQFILKQRHPLIINTKFINLNPTPAIFNMQLTQNYFNLYNKYYINFNNNIKSSYFMYNKNILLHSNFFTTLLNTVKYDLLINNNTTYLYKYNTRLYNNIVLNAFEKNCIYTSTISNYLIALNALLIENMYNNIFINQRHLSYYFKKTITNVNNHQQIFAE
jgi:hypothetical protein